MKPADLERLASQFMLNAVQTGEGDNIWIEYQGPKAKVLADACETAVTNAGGRPYMVDSSAATINGTVGGMSTPEIEEMGRMLLAEMKGMQGYIRVRDDVDKEKISLPATQKAAYGAALREMTTYRVNNTRWLVVSTPTEEFAKACDMSLPDFEAFYMNVCANVDYKKMDAAAQPLEKLMTEGKSVRIFSPQQETDVSFSIEGIPAKRCTGERNIPDGECFTAPVRDSINGIIKFGPSSYDGQRFPWIKLTFEKGKIIDAVSADEERTGVLNEILDRDEGARYTGEFAINFNPYIKTPTGDILFDEKIDGGIHLTPGNCYDDVPNGNKSQIHWDMVHIQRPDYGGGELYIDDRLIRKDGIFVVPELLALNPDQLKNVTDQPKPTL